MIPKEVFQKIRRIQITTSRMVNDVFAGQYHSVFKGKGMEFYEVREYLPGDEIRFIDWNVTARMGQPFIKKFVEERESTVMLMLDASASCRFGSQRQFKNQLAAELCSVLALSAIHNNDKVGLIIFTDKVEKFLPPRKGLRHVLRVIREALYHRPHGTGTDIGAALEYMNRVNKRKTITFVISDFFAAGYRKLMAVSNKRHDIVAVAITDPREAHMPSVGIGSFRDAETGAFTLVDTTEPAFRADYARAAAARRKERKDFFRSLGIDTVDIDTDKPYVHELVKFFKMRQKRKT